RVERSIRFIRENFFAARVFSDVADLNDQAQAWCDGPAAQRPWPESEQLTVRQAFDAEKSNLMAELVLADHARSYDRGLQIEAEMHVQALVDQKRGARQHRATDRLTRAVSAFKMECCPPSPWNGVRDDGGTLSAISMEPCPPSRGIRTHDVAGFLDKRFQAFVVDVPPIVVVKWNCGVLAQDEVQVVDELVLQFLAIDDRQLERCLDYLFQIGFAVHTAFSSQGLSDDCSVECQEVDDVGKVRECFQYLEKFANLPGG